MENIISGIIETLGLGIFFYYLICGLRTKIKSLEETINVQNKTLEVMEKRIIETEKIGDIYRNLISDLPTDIDNYKTIVSKTKDETIIELKNQNELAKKKLADAEKLIQESGNTKEVINIHLKVLKNLLSERKDKKRIKKEYLLTSVCEFGGRSLENSVSLIVKSKTFEEFLNEMGFIASITEEKNIIDEIFRSGGGLFKGKPIYGATATESFGGGWHALVNEYIFINNQRLSEFKDEFSSVKTYA